MRSIIIFCALVVIGITAMVLYVMQLTQRSTTPKQSSLPSSQFSLNNAPKESIRGTISSMSGLINWQSRTATQPSELISPVQIQQGEIVSTGTNGHINIGFPSIGSIDLLPNSSTEIIQTLPVDFVINQSQGITTFTKTGKTPISVRTLNMLTQENSGKMVISVNTNNSTVTVDVLKGEAQSAFNDLNNQSSVQTIQEGNELVFHDDTRQTSINPTSP